MYILTAGRVWRLLPYDLPPEKPDVFKEAFRVLKSGGRVAVSDQDAENKNNFFMFPVDRCDTMRA